jgi:hypothetical protein
MYLHNVYNITFYIENGQFSWKPQQYDICNQNAMLTRIEHLDNTTLVLGDQTCLNIEGQQEIGYKVF